MWTYILRILTILAAVWFALRLMGSLFGKQVKRRSPGSRGRDPSKKMVKDPVCGMYLDPRLAIRSVVKQEEVYFCSEECRKKYIAARN